MNILDMENSRLKRTYGITIDQYALMLAAQEYKCAICGIDAETYKKHKIIQRRFVVDHDHDTGKIRGLLCHGCNSGIGYLKESIKSLESAICYLKRGGAEYTGDAAKLLKTMEFDS